MRKRSGVLALLATLGVLAVVAYVVHFVAQRSEDVGARNALAPQANRSTPERVPENAHSALLADAGGAVPDRQDADDSQRLRKTVVDDPGAGASSSAAREAPVPESSDDSVRSAPRIAGPIRGLLVREGGAWTRETIPQPNTVMIDLVPDGKPQQSVRARIEPRPDSNGNFSLEFEFPDLEEGDYLLTLSALGSWRWAPVSMHVTPPASGITFTRYDKDPRLLLEFDVSDAATGEKISSFQTRNVQLTPSADNGVFLQTGPLDVNSFTVDGRFQWSLWADGYAPAFGDETAFVRTGDKRVADVRLQRGWSTKVLVLARDPVARQAAGARVLVDGHVVGATGVDGMLVVRAPSEPNSLQVEWTGWHSVSDPLQPYSGKSAAQRGQITIVMLEK